MSKTIIAAFSFAIFLVSCTSLKPLAYSNTKQATAPANPDKKEIKFLDINSSGNDNVVVSETKSDAHTSGAQSVNSPEANDHITGATDAEKFSSLQLKYSQLLNTGADQVQNFALYENIDDWYGTRYKLGGTTKWN